MAKIDLSSDAYPSNSNKPRDEMEKEKVTPVVRNDSVVSSKTPLMQKFSNFFVDDAEDLKSYIIFDVLIPGVKNTILDIIEMAFFGDSSRSKYGNSKHTSYASFYKGIKNSNRRSTSSSRHKIDDDEPVKGKTDYRNIILRNRNEAEDVVSTMHERIDRYGSVTIAELFDLVDLPGNSYNDSNWGWTDEHDIGVRRVSKGYLIDVSQAQFIDQ